MKILVISRNAWDDTNSIGNTLTNFFGNFRDIEFANIYFRSAQPNNGVCRAYYRTSETEVLKNWFRPQQIGRSFLWEPSKGAARQNPSADSEKKLIRAIQKHGLGFAYQLSDHLWTSEKWINERLRAFVEDFAPDLVFSFVKSAPQYYLTIKYLRETFDIPLLTWIADDEYTGLCRRGAKKEIENLAYILRESAVVYGCSEEICGYYNRIFGCSAAPFYKSCDLSGAVRPKTGDPIRMVYAGNLLYGRMEILRQLAEVLEAYDGREVAFEIYSNTPLSDQDRAAFDRMARTIYMGRRDYETIKEKLTEADIVLHVESFEEAEMLKTRYSFSTKIIDCLQSGSVLLGIGPKGLASIEYIRRIPGACVVDDLRKIHAGLYAFLDDVASFERRAKAIRAFARRHHDSAVNSAQLKQIIMDIVKGRS